MRVIYRTWHVLLAASIPCRPQKYNYVKLNPIHSVATATMRCPLTLATSCKRTLPAYLATCNMAGNWSRKMRKNNGLQTDKDTHAYTQQYFHNNNVAQGCYSTVFTAIEWRLFIDVMYI